MKITPTSQSAFGPQGKPLVPTPVNCVLDCPVYYFDGQHLKKIKAPLFCSRYLATSALVTLEKFCLEYGFGLVHLGIYYPRYARHEDGTPILPYQWSDHAKGLGIDWRGIVDNDNTYIDFNNLATHSPAKYKPLYKSLFDAIHKINLIPHIVRESAWLHIGMRKG